MFSQILAVPIDALVNLLETILGLDDISTLVYNLDPRNTVQVLSGNVGPFYPTEWGIIGRWYFALAGFLGVFILLAIITSAYKIMFPGKNNPGIRAEAKMGMMYAIGAILMVMAAPVFFQLFAAINNGIVEFFHRLVTAVLGNKLDIVGGQSLIGWDTLITNDWNPFVAALVKLAAWGLVLGINILYIIRKLMLVVFLIGTPLFAGMWAVGRNQMAIGLWAGEILSNLFMQTAHAMVWTLLLVFLKFWNT